MGCGPSSSKANVSPTPCPAVYSTPATPQRANNGFGTNPKPEPIPDVPPVPPVPRPPPLKFEVPIERNGSGASSNGFANSENLIRQHPPRRLLRLEEQQVPLTHQLLDDRLAEADLRRQKILSQRIQSATVRKHRRKPLSADAEWRISGSDDIGENFNEVNPSALSYI